jgi:hypothetical protein
MSLKTRGLSASELARDFGSTMDDFVSRVDKMVMSLTAADASMPAKDRHQAVCSAVWAAIIASTESSSLSYEEREKLAPHLRRVLAPYWLKNCASEELLHQTLDALAPEYLKGRSASSQTNTARQIVNQLLVAIGASDDTRQRLAGRLVPLFAHRMLSNIQYIDDVKVRYGFQFSIVVALVAAAVVAAFAGTDQPVAEGQQQYSA